jgi:metallophosphoesterase (TIGR03767 family)
METTRRQFLALVGAVAALTGLPEKAVAKALNGSNGHARSAAELTTLAETLIAGSANDLGYRQVITGRGEPHIVRTELAKALDGRHGRRRTLVNFVQLTDQHIVDVESPARVEFLDRYNDGECAGMPFSSAYRPQEAASARITDAMLKRLRDIKYSPVTGQPIQAMISTGDNTDNQQFNELSLFIGLMDGSKVTPKSGDPKLYEGVQVSGDLNYWHPDGAVEDLFKAKFGFPEAPGFLEKSLEPISAVGTGVPWYTCYGNHDGLVQGNAPVNPGFNRIAIGGTKVVGAPSGANPCSEFAGPAATGPGHPITADENRRIINRAEWIQAHLDSPGLPSGHGMTKANLDATTLYYTAEVGAVRWIVLDTVNPGGYNDGSVGDAQLNWLRERLDEAQKQRKLVMIFSHHGPRSLENPIQAPDPLDPESTDLPRHQTDAVLEVVDAFSCVIAWVNGHSHANVITQRDGWWDIGTAAHIDWPPQSRMIEVVDNRDGTLSIFGTMVDHGGGGILDLARELMANDPHAGFDHGGTGEEGDRNVELLLPHPFAGGANEETPGVAIPTSGVPSGLTIGGALAVVGGRKLIEFRDRGATLEHHSH